MPEICGRICPQDRLCEGNCVIEKGFESVTIGSVEKYITDTAFAKGWVKPPTPRRELGQSIGIIGAGPAGLAAAEQLRRKGYQVHVYDRYDRVGGLLIYGIPNFKLEKQVVRAAQKLLATRRHHLPSQCRGRPRRHAWPSCAQRHDAMLIATGVYKARDMACPGHRPRQCRARRSTISPRPTARGLAMRCRPSTAARSTPRASMSW